MSKKLSNERRLELLTLLKPYFRKNSTAFCSLKRCSNSGMYRHIQILATKKNRIHNLSYYVAELCGFKWEENTSSVGVSGCGMDMGFHIVNSLSYHLYPNKKRGEYYVNSQWI
jgi:hypothetical protein